MVRQPAIGRRRPPPDLARRGHFFFAIKVSNFCPLDEFTEEVDAEIRTVRNAPRAEGVERIYLPGELEWLHQQDALRNGIPLHPTHLKSAGSTCGRIGGRGLLGGNAYGLYPERSVFPPYFMA